MPIQLGNNYVTEAAYAYAQQRINAQKDSGNSMDKSVITAAAANNILVSPALVRQMEKDPEKQLEIEALIYDCQNVMKDYASNLEKNGIESLSFSMEIDKNGELTMSGLARSTIGGTTNKYSVKLPKDDKNSWSAKMKELQEKIQEKADEEKAKETALEEQMKASGSTFSKLV